MMDVPLGLASGTVRIVPHDARWAELYAGEAERIHTALAERGLSIALEHMGSTAVPGLPAKPVIDILAGWHREEEREGFLATVQDLGYTYRTAQEIPGRDFFRRGDPRQYHLHLARFGGVFWQEQVAFRDLLRTDENVARAYGTLKQNLALAHPRNRDAYLEGKGTFVQESLRLAKARGLYHDLGA